MAKNNKLINNLLQIHHRTQADAVAKASEVITPKIYATIALVLHRNYGWGYKRINDLFNASQEMWAENGWEMCEACYRETGILLETPEQALKNGDFSANNCKECPFYCEQQDGGFVLSVCNKLNGKAYDKVLEDISYQNASTKISRKCPIKRG